MQLSPNPSGARWGQARWGQGTWVRPVQILGPNTRYIVGGVVGSLPDHRIAGGATGSLPDHRLDGGIV